MKRLAVLAFGFALVGVCGLRLGRHPLVSDVSQSKAFYDQTGKLLRLTLSGDHKYRLWTPLREISPQLVEATLLLEDRHFSSHPGVNPLSLVRAAWRTYVGRGSRQGGSTLTMQLARLKYGLRTRTLAGKITQVLRAIQLEIQYSKPEILEAYLNLAPYGGNVEGVWAASRIYFGKAPAYLSLPESLSLAVIPKSPTRRAFVAGARNERLAQARNTLWRRWRDAHPQGQERDLDLELPLSALEAKSLPFLAPHFIDHLNSRGFSEGRVDTSLNLAQQQTLERVIQGYLRQKGILGIKNAAALLIDHRTMAVRGWVGSAGYHNKEIMGQVNGVRAKRSPGSTLKPFIYALGIDQGLIHPMSVLKDTPSSFGSFDPENFDGQFIGPVTVKEALIQSRNIPAVTVTSLLHDPTLYEFLRRGQVTRLKSEAYYGLALPLGGAELTMEELVRLYALLPNGGLLRPLVTLKAADSKEPLESSEDRLLSPESTELILEILKDNPRPGSHYSSDWVRSQLPVYWKTGTSHAFRDAWTLGVFGPYVLGVWIGNFDGATNPNFIGRDAAAPLFFQIVDALRAHEPGMTDFVHPSAPGIRRVKVCALSGKFPGPFCKHQVTTGFIPSKSPIRTCDVHRQVWINPATGRRICSLDRAGARPEVFEFWPTDLMKLFRLAGLPRRGPPPFEKSCSVDWASRSGAPPVIQSPKKDVIYSLRMGKEIETPIPFAAVAETESRDLFWFVDDEFIGKSGTQTPLFWHAKPGRFTVRVVDSEGGADSRELRVSEVQ